jgi:hypothetical protein
MTAEIQTGAPPLLLPAADYPLNYVYCGLPYEPCGGNR